MDWCSIERERERFGFAFGFPFVGLVHSERKKNGKEKISPDQLLKKNMMARYNRAEKFLGISSSPLQHSSTVFNVDDDENEFKEEDVWDTDARREWPEDSSTHESSSSSSPQHMYGGGGGQHFQSHRTDSNESFRYFGSNGRTRWMGGGDPGLAFADAAGGRTTTSTRGLSSLSPVKGGGGNNSSSSSSGYGIATSSSRMIPPTGHHYNHHSHQQQRETMMYHQSAPVNVPDWTRIVGTEKRSSAAGWGNDSSLDHEKDDDGDNEEERLPPHELLAREYANSQATTFSVFEGAGRTLKGRDLSRVRNAVLRKTGFIDY